MPGEQKQGGGGGRQQINLFRKAFSLEHLGNKQNSEISQVLLVAKRLIKDNMGHTCVFDG